MYKTISIRATKELIAIFNKYAALSGKQKPTRPRAVEDFIAFVAGLADDNNEEAAKAELIAAARTTINVSDIESVPASTLKIPIDIEQERWETAINFFKNLFNLKNAPQMPYFLSVSGKALIARLEKQNEEQKAMAVKKVKFMDIKTFKCLAAEDKLNEIYKVLIETGGLK